MRFVLPLLLLLVGCSTQEPKTETLNRWSDERLVAVLDAQDHRDTGKLCSYLSDTSSVVREAAALAFASVRDSASIPCLLKALLDSDATVRSTAVFALGFTADSATVQLLAEAAMNERDTTVQRAYLNASFIAMQRNGMLKDPNAILYYLDRAHGHERVRAADALRRLPDSTVVKLEKEIASLMTTEGDAVRAFLILAMKKLGNKADTARLHRIAVSSTVNAERINAIRVCGALGCMSEAELLDALQNPEARGAALQVLEARGTLDSQQLSRHMLEARATMDRPLTTALLSLAAKHASFDVAKGLREQLLQAQDPQNSPYEEAAILSALATIPPGLPLEGLLNIVASDKHVVVKQAAFLAAVQHVRANMARSRFASREAQYGQLREVVSAAINTNDAGLICSVAELLQEEEPDVIGILFPASLDKAAFAPLQPIRDLEARILLEKAIAKRDGRPAPLHQGPSFNHPIDKARLLALRQGQQYRIVTNKGEVVISTDVNECPGSSLAFDSLVTAGYYNGKYFHRMVPNFVVQGGCPRGDGYGGMPWTLRTEIGRSPFTAGSVGLASAGADTESCQFFITHSAAPHLDGRYTRFGEVVSGMDVVWELQVGDVMEKVERVE